MSETLVDSGQIDNSKRTWLIASGCVGAVGGVAAVVPFVSSFQPSEKAKAAGAAVEADISGLKPGEKMTVEWRGKPVWIVRRTPEQLAALPALDSQLADPKSERKPDEQAPKYARNASRAIKDEYLVWAYAPIWVVHLQINSQRVRSRLCRTIGRVVFSAHVTGQLLTWRGVCTRTSLRLITSKFLLTCTSLMPNCSSVMTRKPKEKQHG